MTEVEVRECVWCGRSFTTNQDLREKCGECYLKTNADVEKKDAEQGDLHE